MWQAKTWEIGGCISFFTFNMMYQTFCIEIFFLFTNTVDIVYNVIGFNDENAKSTRVM